MSTAISKRILITDLHQRVAAHCETVVNAFCTLATPALRWQPLTKGKAEWSILQCFDHLNLTHDYYMAKIAGVLVNAPRADARQASYQPSFWGGIYMYFALNPKYSFPSPKPISPATQPDRQVLTDYLARQEVLLQCFDNVDQFDLVKTRVPIEKFVRFNLGDCLKILVYHDELHIGQAQRVYQARQEPQGEPAVTSG